VIWEAFPPGKPGRVSLPLRFFSGAECAPDVNNLGYIGVVTDINNISDIRSVNIISISALSIYQ
jgi:hypothetical protein